MTVKQLRETKNIYSILCVADVIVMIIVAAFRPLHMIMTTYMYSMQDKIGLALTALFIAMVMLFLRHHQIYSVAEYRYRVAMHHKNQKRNQMKKEQ